MIVATASRSTRLALPANGNPARAAAARLLQLQPELSLRWLRRNLPVPNAEFLDRYVEGFRLAGIPE